MKILFTIGLVSLTLIHAAPKSKHTAYDLPATAELLVGDIRTTFVCKKNGYYADKDNFCKIFHVCHTVLHPDGTPELVQWSFICGNKTIFNQFTLKCSYPEDSIPCGRASDFWYLNANIGVSPNVPIHNEQDVVRAVAVTESSAARPLKLERIPQFSRTSFPKTTLRQPTTRTRVWKPSLVIADRSLHRRVPVPHPTTTSPYAQQRLRPNAITLSKLSEGGGFNEYANKINTISITVRPEERSSKPSDVEVFCLEFLNNGFVMRSVNKCLCF